MSCAPLLKAVPCCQCLRTAEPGLAASALPLLHGQDRA